MMQFILQKLFFFSPHLRQHNLAQFHTQSAECYVTTIVIKVANHIKAYVHLISFSFPPPPVQTIPLFASAIFFSAQFPNCSYYSCARDSFS